jgi:hypothetical protein
MSSGWPLGIGSENHGASESGIYTTDIHDCAEKGERKVKGKERNAKCQNIFLEIFGATQVGAHKR